MSAALTEHPSAPTSGFSRGFALAALWADDAREMRETTLRVRPLESDPSSDFLAAGRVALPADRHGLVERWLGEEPERRIDHAIDLHWTWLPPLLEPEPAPLLVVFLSCLRPELARETLRAAWPRLRNLPSAELEDSPLPAETAARLRVEFFSCFVLAADAPGEGFGLVLQLERKELHLLLQAMGFKEIARAGGSDAPPELSQRLAGFRGDDAPRLVRLFARGEAEAGGESGADRERPTRLARAHLLAGLDAAGADGDLLEFVGLNQLAAVLSGEPRDAARRLAQKMQRPTGLRLLEWRDDWAAIGYPEAEATREELIREARAARARSGVPSVANRVWA